MARPRTRKDLPPPLERACLNALWRLGEGTVRQVREALEPGHHLAYTTVLTVLERLARKGLVERRPAGRRYVYRAALSREEARRAAVRDLLQGYFDGSLEELLAFLRASSAHNGEPSPDSGGLDTVLL